MLNFTAVEVVTNLSQWASRSATICSKRSLKKDYAAMPTLGERSRSPEWHQIFAKLKVTPSLCCRLEWDQLPSPWPFQQLPRMCTLIVWWHSQHRQVFISCLTSDAWVNWEIPYTFLKIWFCSLVFAIPQGFLDIWGPNWKPAFRGFTSQKPAKISQFHSYVIPDYWIKTQKTTNILLG